MDREVTISDRITLLLPSYRVRVAFSTSEDWQLRQVNLWRQATHLGEPDPQIARRRDGKDTSLMGVRAEYAVARVLGVPFDLASNLDRDLKALDFYLDDGVTVQVKSTDRMDGRLLFHPTRFPFVSDYAVLCHSPETFIGPVTIYGYIGRVEFNRVAETVDLGQGVGPQPVARPEQLHPVLDLGAMHLSRCQHCGQRKPPTNCLHEGT